MLYITVKILPFLYYVLVSLAAYASTDIEIYESNKCSSLFTIYEQKYGIPKNLMYSMSLYMNHKDHSKCHLTITWPWTININGNYQFFENKKEAVNFVRQKIQNPNNQINVGCMQINVQNNINKFKSIEELLSPKKNIEFTANFLKNNYSIMNNWYQVAEDFYKGTTTLPNNYQTIRALHYDFDRYLVRLKQRTKMLEQNHDKV
mgnify:CR=1 FL=1